MSKHVMANLYPKLPSTFIALFALFRRLSKGGLTEAIMKMCPDQEGHQESIIESSDT
jgi:hypothetical protein